VTGAAPRPLLDGLLPGAVVVAERFRDPPAPQLFPQEEALVEAAVEKRRREFATVRTCAREALARLGIPPVPILPLGGAAAPFGRRAPRWPTGVVGSMTHCDGYRGAALARSAALASVGVDAESHLPLPARVTAAIATPEESESLDALREAEPETAWERILFSAKESVYKALFPLTGHPLGFHDCTITLCVDGNFAARVQAGPGRPQDDQRLSGRWRVRPGEGGRPALIGTALAVPN
jgi:enterobactin synthetase component D / holo-[acyl-carrier protein] synthase